MIVKRSIRHLIHFWHTNPKCTAYQPFTLPQSFLDSFAFTSYPATTPCVGCDVSCVFTLPSYHPPSRVKKHLSHESGRLISSSIRYLNMWFREWFSGDSEGLIVSSSNAINLVSYCPFESTLQLLGFVVYSNSRQRRHSSQRKYFITSPWQKSRCVIGFDILSFMFTTLPPLYPTRDAHKIATQTEKDTNRTQPPHDGFQHQIDRSIVQPNPRATWRGSSAKQTVKNLIGQATTTAPTTILSPCACTKVKSVAHHPAVRRFCEPSMSWGVTYIHSFHFPSRPPLGTAVQRQSSAPCLTVPLERQGVATLPRCAARGTDEVVCAVALLA